MAVSVRAGSLEEALELIARIPEFDLAPNAATWHQRLEHDPVILLATIQGRGVGFKAGYDRNRDGHTYYSWMGGVLPAFRRRGVASALQLHMEQWCRDRHFSSLRFKTRNKHRNMISFAFRHGFDLIDFEKKGEVGDYRLWFEKALT